MSDEKPENLRQAVIYLQKAVANAVVVTSQISPNDLNTLLKAYKLLNDQADQIEAATKELNKMINRLKTEVIPKQLIDLEVDSIKMAGYNFILGTTTYASIPEDKREVGYKWLRDNGYGELIKETVHAKSLASIVKAIFEETAQDPPEEAMTIHRGYTINMRKA